MAPTPIILLLALYLDCLNTERTITSTEDNLIDGQEANATNFVHLENHSHHHYSSTESDDVVAIITGMAVGLLFFLMIFWVCMTKCKYFVWKKRMQHRQIYIEDNKQKAQKHLASSSGSSGQETKQLELQTLHLEPAPEKVKTES